MTIRNISFIPYEKDQLKNRLFDPELVTQASTNEWFILRNNLALRGFRSSTVDVSLFSSATFFYYNSYYFSLLPIIVSIFKRNIYLIYLQTEPEVVFPINSKKNLSEINKYFDIIYSYNEKLENLSSFRKIHLTFAKLEFINSSEKLNDMCMVLSNKFSYHRDEKYSFRREAVEYFLRSKLIKFDLYGLGWPSNYKSNGFVNNKTEIISKYRFCLVIENTFSDKGYLTERIFDVFQSLTVPVYYGIGNIEEYIPKSCFINGGKFQSFGELESYLSNIDDKEYNSYLNAIRGFRISTAYESYTTEYFVDYLLDGISNPFLKPKDFFSGLKILIYFSFINSRLFINKITNKIRRLIKGIP
jgi:hypothetical protein